LRSKSVVAAICVVAFALFCAVALASAWKVVKKGSKTGKIASVAINTEVLHPKGIAVSAKNANGFVAWACSPPNSVKVKSWSKNWGPGFHVLAHAGGEGSCSVSATFTGSGHVTVEILRK
jgi:hypothetical protein